MQGTRHRWNGLPRWFAALLLAYAGVACAGAGTELRVSAVVRDITRLQVISQPAVVHVTEADVARGYVEVPAPMQVAVRSNSAQGYMLAFDSQSDFFRQAHVRGLPRALQVGASGGMVPQPSLGRGVTQVVLALGFRFDLSQDTRPGTYPWPLQLSAAPL